MGVRGCLGILEVLGGGVARKRLRTTDLDFSIERGLLSLVNCLYHNSTLRTLKYNFFLNNLGENFFHISAIQTPEVFNVWEGLKGPNILKTNLI